MTTALNRSIKLRGPLAAAVLAAAATLLATATPASASTSQVTILQDGSFKSSPTTALPIARELGARVVRVTVSWYQFAPKPSAKRKPSFAASSPNSYPAASWAPYDQLVQQAKRDGLTVALQVTGGAPQWAQGPGQPAYFRQRHDGAWKPNAKMYGQFVHAVGQRYSGHFRPPGAATALPKVSFWSLWNEPNFGTYIAPQTTNRSTVPVAPAYYRAMLAAGWKALAQTGHRHDKLLFGELDPLGNAIQRPGHGGPNPGSRGVTGGVWFVRALYCLDSSYHPVTGKLAASWRCPTSRAASRRFRASNPALFQATGFADHPYSFKQSPAAKPSSVNGNYVTLPVLFRLTRALDKATRAYGSGKHFPIYNTEFGFITRPPAGPSYPSQAKSSIWLNQAEYISYKNPRVASYDQYLINDPPRTKANPNPGFNTGVFTASGTPKATLNAFRLPIWLPKQTVRRGTNAEIWGAARPGAVVSSSRSVQIQAQKNGRGAWTTIRSLTVRAGTGYFDIRMKLPYSGNLRLSYTYSKTSPFLPIGVAGTTVYSRTVPIKVKG